MLCWSAALLVLTDNDGMSESQPTLTMMSTIVMRIVHFRRVNAQEKLNCLCDGGNDGVLSERLLEPNRWNVGIAVKELLHLHHFHIVFITNLLSCHSIKTTNKRRHKKFSKLWRRGGALSLRVLPSFVVIKSWKAPLAQCAQNS